MKRERERERASNIKESLFIYRIFLRKIGKENAL